MRISPRAPTAIVIDDDPAVLRLTVKALEQSGITCTSFYDAEAALSWLVTNHEPDLVVTDVGLPRLNGIAFVRELRRHARFAHTKYLVVTARLEVNAALEASR